MKKGFVIHHNGPAANCLDEPHARCERFWKAVRDYHVNTKGWSDIAYSFGVCPHGVRFVGRGWDKNQFANGDDVVGTDDGGDRYWYSVLAFIGGDEKPTSEMVLGLQDVIHEGRTWARCLDRVLPHNAFKPKACPGPELTLLAKEWDNVSFDTPAPTPIPTPPEQELTNPMAMYVLARTTNDHQRVAIIDGPDGPVALLGHDDVDASGKVTHSRVVVGPGTPVVKLDDRRWKQALARLGPVLDDDDS